MKSNRTRLSILLATMMGCLTLVAASVQVAPLCAERLPNGNTLIADGKVLQGASDACALEVDSLGRLVWAYVKGDVPFLHTARRLANGNTLMSSSLGNKVLEVDLDGERVWLDSAGLAYPTEAFRLANDHTLITDRDNNRVIEVDSACHIVWQYLCFPSSAQRLANGNTVIAESYLNRVIEVDYTGAIAWSATGLAAPRMAVRLSNGNTLVSEMNRVIELTPADSIVWQYPNTGSVMVETLQVVNPTSGCTLYVHIHRPACAGPDNRLPGVVFVPGGTGFGSSYDSTGLPDNIASDGFALAHFDPDGRGRSSAYPENYDGYVQQDGMHACLSLLASRDYVDTTRLGVYSTGYGITMGSGMIARYAEPRVTFLLDFEGPADRSQTCQDSGGFVPVPANSDTFWAEREAARFMKFVPGAYLRVQTAIDSNPLIPDNRHAIQLIDSATAFGYGGAGISSWTRVNDPRMNPVNHVYTSGNPPARIPEVQEPHDFVRVLLYLHELSGKYLEGVTEGRGVGPVASLRAFPLPCRGVLHVGLPSRVGARELQVHDICGRLVARTAVPAGSSRTTLDLHSLQPGVYYASTAGAGTVPVVIVR